MTDISIALPEDRVIRRPSFTYSVDYWFFSRHASCYTHKDVAERCISSHRQDQGSCRSHVHWRPGSTIRTSTFLACIALTSLKNAHSQYSLNLMERRAPMS